MLTLWENTAATVAQHAEFPGAARAFMAQPRVSFARAPLSSSFPPRPVPSRRTAAAETRADFDPNLAILLETNDDVRSFRGVLFKMCSK